MVDRREDNRLSGWRFIALVILGLIVFGSFLPKPKPGPTATQPAAKPVGMSDEERRVRAERDVKDRLRDPESADFGPMTVRSGVVCGTVNSRNGFGGMSGKQRFISRAGAITVFADDVKGEGFNETWNSLC